MNKREFKHNIKDFFKKLKEFVKSDEFIAGLVFGVCILASVLLVSSCVHKNRIKASAQVIDDNISNIAYDDTTRDITAEEGTLEFIDQIFEGYGRNIVQEVPLFMLPIYTDSTNSYYVPALNTVNVKFVYNTFWEAYVAYALPKIVYNSYAGNYYYTYDVYKPIVDFTTTGDIQTVNGRTYFNLDFFNAVYTRLDPYNFTVESRAIRFWFMFNVLDADMLFNLKNVDGLSFPRRWGGVLVTRHYYSFNRAYGTFTPNYSPPLSGPSRFETMYYEKNVVNLNFMLKFDGYDENNTFLPAIFNVNYLKPCLLSYDEDSGNIVTTETYFENDFILLNQGVQEFSFETIDFRGDSLDDTEAAYNVGYTDGREFGYDEGYNEGYKDGEVAGYQNGFENGSNRSYTDGYNNGYSAGYDVGYDEGSELAYDWGYDDGYDVGKKEGYDSGYGYGYDEGYEAGLASNEGGGTYAEGYVAGLAAGRLEGNEAYYDQGYNIGHDDGYAEGHDDGYYTGYSQGVLESYDTGYDAGYSIGYDVGYDNGLEDGDGGGGFNLFRGLIKSVDTLFNTPIAGENVTLGLILSVGLGLTCLVVLLKTFFGG